MSVGDGRVRWPRAAGAHGPVTREKLCRGVGKVPGSRPEDSHVPPAGLGSRGPGRDALTERPGP